MFVFDKKSDELIHYLVYYMKKNITSKRLYMRRLFDFSLQKIVRETLMAFLFNTPSTYTPRNMKIGENMQRSPLPS
jgi:hypothetical protein